MNADNVRGFVLSRTNQTNTVVAGLVSLAASQLGWELTSEQMAWVVSGIFLVVNYFMRSITTSSLAEKGYRPPNPKTVSLIKEAVIEEMLKAPLPTGKQQTVGDFLGAKKE